MEGKKRMKPKNTLKFLFMVLKLFVFSSWVVFILFALRVFFFLSPFSLNQRTLFSLTSLHIQMQMLLLATPWIKIMEKKIQQQFTQWAYFTYLIWKCFWYICKDPVRVHWNGIDYHSLDRRQNNLQNEKQSRKSHNVTTWNEQAQFRWKQITIRINLCCYLLQDSIAVFSLFLPTPEINEYETSLNGKQTLTEGDTKQIIISCLFGTEK